MSKVDWVWAENQEDEESGLRVDWKTKGVVVGDGDEEKEKDEVGDDEKEELAKYEAAIETY